MEKLKIILHLKNKSHNSSHQDIFTDKIEQISLLKNKVLENGLDIKQEIMGLGFDYTLSFSTESQPYNTMKHILEVRF